MRKDMSRRTFVKGCCAGITAMAGVNLGNLVFAEPQKRLNGSGQLVPADVLISVFLRGGMDGLSFVVPYGDSDYHTARPDLGLDGPQVIDLDGQFGLHPSAASLKMLYDSQHLALIQACGSPDPSRSHFEAQDNMDRGQLDGSLSHGGWLARHLGTQSNESIFRAISYGSALATSLEGLNGALSLQGASGFTFNGSSSQKDDLRRALRDMYADDPDLKDVAIATLDAVDVIDHANPGSYEPPVGVEYPSSSFGDALKQVAQLVRLDLGLQAATVDVGGWDTHENQAGGDPVTGTFAGNVADLSNGLFAFFSDMASWTGSKVTVVMMSEFGRRLKENKNRGSDHGHGNVMAVLSNDIVQTKVWGTWPGLGYDQLFEHVDLEVTTDFRTILGEVLVARLGQTALTNIFPGYTYPGPLGIFGAAGQLPQSSSGLLIR